MLFRIVISAVLTVIVHFLPTSGLPRFFTFLIPYLVVGYDILLSAVRGIVNRQIFDESFLMTIATVGAMILGLLRTNDYTEAVAVMLFYQTGELFQNYAVGKSRRNISELMDIRPDCANIEDDGKLKKVSPEEVAVGTVITVNPGEKIPIDGIITEGTSEINCSALTGESVPRSVTVADEVLSGCINESGTLKIRTTAEFYDSAVSRILDLVENASSKKSSSENFISKFARYYTPAVCISALALAFIVPLFRMLVFKQPADFGEWIYRALTFLVISCPCALVISIPLTFFAAIGTAGKNGILIKGSGFIETLSKTKTAVFDKTGTLTKGSFSITSTHSENIPVKDLIEMTALAESASSHPISRSLKTAYGKEIDNRRIREFCEIRGYGVRSTVDGKNVAVGSSALMSALGIKYKAASEKGTIVHVSSDDEYRGYIVISDTVKENSEKAVKALKAQGIRTVMFTGDKEAVAEKISSDLSIDSFCAELLPDQKVSKVEELLSSLSGNEKLIFVGDGINDAPSLMRADAGIAMGAIGSDAAVEAADVVLMNDDPLSIPKVINISKKCMRIVRQNISFAVGIKILCLVLGAFGITNMWIAVFADVGVMILSVLNALRVMLERKNHEQ